MKLRVWVVLAILLLGSNSQAWACAVCLGGADSTMTDGMNNGILALLGVIAVVQGGFVALFISIRRRMRKHRERRESFRLIEGGVR